MSFNINPQSKDLISRVTHIEKTENDTVYVNVEIRPPDDLVGGPAIALIQRTEPILLNASRYYYAIIRAEIPNFFVPATIMPIQNDQGNVNLSQYSITLQHGLSIQQEYIVFEPRGTFPIPISPNQTENGEQVNSPYYWVYEYQWFLDMLNTTFQTAFTNLATKTLNSDPPIMTYNQESKFFSIVSQNAFYNVDTTPANDLIKVYFNQKLWTLFNGFNVQQYSIKDTFTSDGRDIEFLLKDNYFNSLNNPLYNPPFLGDFIVNTQQNSSILNWNPFKRIVITSANLPIVSEYVGLTGNRFRKVVTDFAPLASPEIRTIWNYNPDIYRLINMTTHQDIKTIDLQFYWVDSKDRFNRIYIPWNQQITMKLGFFNKAMYKNDIHSFIK